jgi:hypothetical protein
LKIKIAGTSHNRSVYASPPVGGSGYGFARSFASLIPTQNLRHSLSALQTQRVCLFGPPNRRKQPERYAKFFNQHLVVPPYHPWHGNISVLYSVKIKEELNQEIRIKRIRRFLVKEEN